MESCSWQPACNMLSAWREKCFQEISFSPALTAESRRDRRLGRKILPRRGTALQEEKGEEGRGQNGIWKASYHPQLCLHLCRLRQFTLDLNCKRRGVKMGMLGVGFIPSEFNLCAWRGHRRPVWSSSLCSGLLSQSAQRKQVQASYQTERASTIPGGLKNKTKHNQAHVMQCGLEQSQAWASWTRLSYWSFQPLWFCHSVILWGPAWYLPSCYHLSSLWPWWDFWKKGGEFYHLWNTEREKKRKDKRYSFKPQVSWFKSEMLLKNTALFSGPWSHGRPMLSGLFVQSRLLGSFSP